MQILCGLQVVFFLFNCQTPVPLFIRLPLYIFTKIGQIGALGDYIHFKTTVCGNSSYLLLQCSHAFAILYLSEKIIRAIRQRNPVLQFHTRRR